MRFDPPFLITILHCKLFHVNTFQKLMLVSPRQWKIIFWVDCWSRRVSYGEDTGEIRRHRQPIETLLAAVGHAHPSLTEKHLDCSTATQDESSRESFHDHTFYEHVQRTWSSRLGLTGVSARCTARPKRWITTVNATLYHHHRYISQRYSSSV